MAALVSKAVSGRERRIRLAAFACLVGLLAAVAFYAVQHPMTRGDSRVLARGAEGIVDCFRRARFTSCDQSIVHGHSGDRTVYVGPYPLLQYIPAVGFHVFGISREPTLRLLTVLNTMSLIAILALALRTVKRLAPPMWVPLVAVAIVASPLLMYGRSALGEELAAAVILAAVAAVLLDAELFVVVPLVVLACISKETNPPFVFALTAICTLARTEARDPVRRRRLLALAAATVTGVALNLAFNVMRYGTVRNTLYTKKGFQTTNVGIVSRLFAALWFSPNGGIAWFWPLAPLLILTIAIVSYRRRPMSWRRVAVPVVALLLIIQIAALSTWWSPFGWYAWGPRLTLPLVPALLVAACVLGAPAATMLVARFLRGRWFWPATLAVVVIGLPEALALAYPRGSRSSSSPSTAASTAAASPIRPTTTGASTRRRG